MSKVKASENKAEVVETKPETKQNIRREKLLKEYGTIQIQLDEMSAFFNRTQQRKQQIYDKLKTIKD